MHFDIEPKDWALRFHWVGEIPIAKYRDASPRIIRDIPTKNSAIKIPFVSTVSLCGGDLFSARKLDDFKSDSLQEGLFWGWSHRNGISYADGFRYLAE